MLLTEDCHPEFSQQMDPHQISKFMHGAEIDKNGLVMSIKKIRMFSVNQLTCTWRDRHGHKELASMLQTSDQTQC